MKKRKRLIALITAVLLFTIFYGCSGQATDKDTVKDTGKKQASQEESSTKKAGKETSTQKEGKESPEAATAAEETETKDKADMIEEAFYKSKITDEIFKRIDGKSFKEECTLPRKDLRYLHVLHKDIDGEEHEGEMIVNRHIADDVLEIFKELYKQDYPIEKIRLVDEYDADDETSMRDNNSSAFNFRFISHTQTVSKHGLGLAVDINPLYNPYTKVVNGERTVEPATGEDYLDREKDFDYKIEKDDLCYELFTEHGFKWGGEWENSKDYQHFEISDDKIEEWYPDN